MLAGAQNTLALVGCLLVWLFHEHFGSLFGSVCCLAWFVVCLLFFGGVCLVCFLFLLVVCLVWFCLVGRVDWLGGWEGRLFVGCWFGLFSDCLVGWLVCVCVWLFRFVFIVWLPAYALVCYLLA